MSMHLLGPYFTTTNTKSYKRKRKKKTRKQMQIDENYEKFLRSKGLHLEQLIENRLKRPKQKITSGNSKVEEKDIKSVGGITSKLNPNIYSGNRKLLGIATMHKSNMVPVFDKQSAEDISKMRR